MGIFLCRCPLTTFTGSGLDGIFEEVSAKSKSLNLSNFFLDITTLRVKLYRDAKIL
jgi:hypothetical protein